MSKITPKERGLIKGALRRVFSRSELRKQAIAAVQISHYDPDRPRVTKWGVCPICTKKTPLYLMEVDHTIPLVPIGKGLEDMTWDELITRLWCDPANLQALCKPCHKEKSKAEAKERREVKKAKKKLT